MNQYLVQFTAPASNDLEEIFCYIAFVLMEPETADRQISRIEDQISKLSYFPEKPWHSMGIHQLPVDHYVIYYMIRHEDKIVNVTRILYSGRNMDTMKLL